MTRMHPRGFSETLSTKRGPMTGVRRGAPIAELSNIRCSVIIPLDPTAQQEVFARGISVDYQIFCDSADIVPEDVVTVDSVDYVVVEVAPWTLPTPRVMQLSLRKYQG